jgi:TRAP-type C4-dicarboxylate transport system substrate-binding protein
MMKKLIKAAVSAALLTAMPILAGAAQAQTVLKASSWVAATHPLHESILVPWAAEVDKATQGRVKVEILPKAVATPQGHFDAVQDGLADVTFNIHGYVPGRFPLTKLVEFPFTADNAENLSVAYHRVYERHFAKANEHKGLKVLALFTHGPGQIFNSKKPIAQLSDFQGLKFRVGGGMVNDVAKLIGANAFLKPATESYELLSGGVVDGVFFPAESIASFKLQDLVKFVTQVPGGIYTSSIAMFMNADRFNSLPKADQDAIMSVSGEKLSRLAGRAWDERDQRGWQAMRDKNMTITQASPEFVNAMKEKIVTLEQAWFAEAKAKGFDGAKALAELREEVKKVAAGQ